MINKKFIINNKLIIFIFSLVFLLGINIRNASAAEDWQYFEDLGTTLEELLQVTSPQNINIYIEGKYITDISITSNKISGQAGVISIDVNKNESVSRLNVKLEANGGLITKQSDANKIIKSGKTVFNAGFLIDKSDVDYDYDLTFTAYDSSDNVLQAEVFKSKLQIPKEAFKIVDKSNGGKPYTLQQLIENQSLFQTVLKEKIKIKQMLVLDNVSIDFLNNKLLGTTANMEYSFNSTNGLLGTFEACTDTETIVSTLVPGKVICIREKGAPNNYRLIEISKEAAAPKFTIDYLNEKTVEVIPSTIEYSTSKTFSTTVSGSGAKLDLSIYADTGASIYFRYKATTGAMPSKSFELKVPKRPIKLVITANYLTGTTTQKILTTTEYAKDESFISGYNIGEGQEVALEENTDYYFRVKATEKNFKGETLKLTVNGQVPGVPSYTIDYINETTNQVVPTTVEYSYDSQFKGEVFSGNGRKLVLDPGNTTKTLFFRFKGTSSLFPGEALILVIDARPAATSYSIDYENKSTKEILEVTDEYAQDIKFTKGKVAGNGVSYVNLNPDTRDKKLYFRVKATSNSFSGVVQELQIPALPSAPTYAIDFINENIKSVVDEYKIGETGTFIKGNGIDINMSDYLGKNIYFKKSAIADGQFESQTQVIKIPARPKAPAYTIDYNNATTNQVVPSTVEISETDTFASTTAGQGTKLLLYPGISPKTLYFRVKASQNNFVGESSELYVPAAVNAGPVFTINYSEEKTMQPVSSNIEYSYDKDFITGKTVGEGKTLVLIPGKDVYFRYKAGYNSFPSLTTKLTVPSRPRISGNFRVDFENETVLADSDAYVDSRYEYSGDVTFTGTIKNANGGPLPVTSGSNIYIRLRATNADFSSEIYEVMVPQRPEVQNFTIDTVNKTTQQIVPDYVSYKVMNGDVVVKDYTLGNNDLLDISDWNGYTIYFQIKATDTYFKSNEKSVKIEF
ncbi:hypothetical protein CLHOM_21560 [Clostridium homopropionicum DSM 5847]|uniref:Uncharacterized protein n=1 Tax=Clostridium homopropionicum DSM 5847 TaxID=1121318 RepID=A0A0L6Z8S2_9CLOT|nr:hypothetical protein [Clostridium homopropionicum]KOA19365.1 hypothetical protein CLHOM_21560 [Clostridium homopropionicum DSM 5847]SFG67580.1 hypothetical protein SAMN04488501_1135 [Clostridium homopropionicum]